VKKNLPVRYGLLQAIKKQWKQKKFFFRFDRKTNITLTAVNALIFFKQLYE